jgi:imidazolonepropionase-like amidohydrolase
VVKTCGANFDRLILREPAAIDMAIGDPPKAAFGEAQKSPVTRMSIAALIRKSLVEAQEYDGSLKAYEAKSEADKKKTPRPPRDLNMEALGKLLNREIPARIESDLADDLRTAIRIAEEFQFDLVIDSGLTAYLLKDILVQKRYRSSSGRPLTRLSAAGR